jgi:hypothetical protein
MGNTQSSPSLHALDPLQKHIFNLIYHYFQPPSQISVKDVILEVLDIAFLVRSVHGTEVDPSRVKLVNTVKPKVEESDSFIASQLSLHDKVYGPIHTLVPTTVYSGTVGDKGIVEIEHRSHRVTSTTMMALLEKAHEEIKVILEKEARIKKAAELAQQAKIKETDELVKKIWHTKMALEMKAILKAHTILSTMPGPMPGAFPDTFPKRMGEPSM